MKRADFEFELPPELIAQQPVAPRSASRLLQLDGSGACADFQFAQLPGLICPGDLLIFNDTRVVPARVFGRKPSGGRVEMLLERILAPTRALVHLRASKALKPGATIELANAQSAHFVARQDDLFVLDFSCDVLAFLEAYGSVPLPPYIAREAEIADRENYQTVYARERGAVAAPTAGLHFDAPLLSALHQRGIGSAFITLHVGAGTFAPVRDGDIESHVMHCEFVRVPAETCAAIQATRVRRGRIIAVGTTVVRSLETAAMSGELAPYEGETTIFVKPGHRFRSVDALITNFHLPGSTLMMLCAAFIGRENLLGAYRHAIAARYRFFSYGDAMLLRPEASAK